ncbi:hypothetical protein ABNX05_22200 [Lysinibacillus sp. M3]|uniref:AAA family ATPase n=1 Tax=Lysinibacillus zambalensis TaxID=3160866 RepID=A0ABV1MXU1_9BACI
MNTIDNLAISLLSKPFTVLYGPSGTGKTRAAIELAQKINDHSALLTKQNNVKEITINSNGLILEPSEDEVREMVTANIYNDNNFEAEKDGQLFPIQIECCSNIKFINSSDETIYSPNGTATAKINIHIDDHLSCYKVIPVASNWSDNKSLIGYINPFGTNGETIYEITPFIELLLLANHPNNVNKPFFSILDEMNLSHVEYYLSDILSLMEISQYGENEVINFDTLKVVKRTLQLNYSKYNHYLLTAAELLLNSNKGLIVPQNFFIVGTINLDETTQMLSNKVLDRAHLIKIDTLSPSQAIDSTGYSSIFTNEDMYNKFSRIIPLNYYENFKDIYNTLAIPSTFKYPNSDDLINLLDVLYNELQTIDQSFGYRVIQEVFTYMITGFEFYDKDPIYLDTLLNNALNQKVLVKLHGNRRTLPMACNGLKAKLDEATFSEVFKRLDNLLFRLELRGQATFIS